MGNQEFDESSVKDVIITSHNPLEGEVIIPGDKVASIHLLLATLVTNNRTLIHNIHYCGDLNRLASWSKRQGLAEINYEGDILTVTPHSDSFTEIDLSSLGDTRSNICLVTALTLKHGAVVFKGTGGCNFTERKIDRHLELMNAFGIDVKAVSDKNIAKIASIPETIRFDCVKYPVW